MNAGVRLDGFVMSLTGITTQMIRRAPPAAQVMQEAAAFVGETPLIASNGSFDRGFWDAELARLGLSRNQPFACSILVTRRVMPDAAFRATAGGVTRSQPKPDA